jgi:hypothetical protein
MEVAGKLSPPVASVMVEEISGVDAFFFRFRLFAGGWATESLVMSICWGVCEALRTAPLGVSRENVDYFSVGFLFLFKGDCAFCDSSGSSSRPSLSFEPSEEFSKSSALHH